MLMGAVLAAAAQAAADPANARAQKSDEIIVTGERVKRALKDTPSSVHVVTARELEAIPLDRLADLLAGIPNLQVGSGSQGPAIRGQDSTGVLNSLPAFLGGARPRATLEVDGRAVGFQEFVFGDAPLWDVQQVEVFRSPLTVTHGRNSIGGGIVVTTSEPTYYWTEGARFIGGNFSTRQASGMLSGPIASDQLAFRLSGDIRHSRETVRLAPLMRGADPNDDDYSQLRFKLLGEPRALPGLKVIATFARSYSRRPQDVPVLAPFSKREFPYGGYGIFRIKVNSATIHATQQIAGGQVEAVLSLGDTRSRRFAEVGRGESHAHFKDFSGELFGNWKIAETVTLRGGIHELNSRFHQNIDLTRFLGSIGEFHDRQTSFGAFGEAEVALAPRLTVSAGGRYQEDRQRRDGGLAGAITAPIVFDKHFSEFLPKATVSYALTGRLKAGILVQKAYNPGGATLDFDTGGLNSFGAERLWDYEAFVKGDLPGGGMSIEANVFFNDIRDAQRGVLIPIARADGTPDFLFKYRNVPKAWTEGAEAEIGWHQSKALRLNGGIGWLRTRIVNTSGQVIGREFERSPHFTASGAADWTPTKSLRLSAQVRYHGSYFSGDFDDPTLRVGPAAMINVRGAYTVRGLTIFAYARNALNNFHVNYWIQRRPDIVEADDPRVVGVGMEMRF